MTVDESSSGGIKRERSPSHPSFGVQEAIEKLKLIHSRIKSQGVTRKMIETALDVKKALAGEIISTLKHFGLVDAPRGGKVKISQLGLMILLGIGEERDKAIRAAAAAPELYKKYRKKWGQDTPDDKICCSQLRLEDKFAEWGARKFLFGYRKTMEFIQTTELGSSEEASDNLAYSIEEASGEPDVAVLGSICVTEDKNIDQIKNDSISKTNRIQRLNAATQITAILNELSPGDQSAVLSFVVT